MSRAVPPLQPSAPGPCVYTRVDSGHEAHGSAWPPWAVGTAELDAFLCKMGSEKPSCARGSGQGGVARAASQGVFLSCAICVCGGRQEFCPCQGAEGSQRQGWAAS